MLTYIYFVDADDYVEKNFLPDIVTYTEKKCLDVLLFSFQPVCDDQELQVRYNRLIRETKRTYSCENVITGQELLCNLIEKNEYHVTVWIQLVKRQLLIDHNIYFCDGILFEDNLYTFNLLMSAQRCCCLTRIGYYKRFREGSICTSEEKPLYVQSFLITYQKMIKTMREFSDNRLKIAFGKILSDIRRQIIKRYLRLSDSDKITLSIYLTKSENELLNSMVE